MTRRWLVTGGSSGLGRALAEAVAASGDLVAVTARRTAALDTLVAAWPEHIVPIPLELRDADACEEAVRIACDRLGGVDVLVNNAGGGLFGAVEEVSDAELRDQLEVLVVGPWRMTRLVLPGMRARGAGCVVNVSSLGGRMPFPGLASYVTGKHALEGMSQALAAEVGGFGVRVLVVEPGVFATRYGASLAEPAAPVPAYAEVNGPMLAEFRGMADNPEYGRPEDFAAAVLALVRAEAPVPVRVPVGEDAYAYLEAVTEAGHAEFAAARALTRDLRAAPPR
ncbi:SDR family oxidoreductase (plasmid) [Streptomyces sp. BI20]|uniref:SDR family oxidoreductase n=1 Tax=Streptomyces sp. BI20 TaxID=3403460 RepID=UPI003C70886B